MNSSRIHLSFRLLTVGAFFPYVAPFVIAAIPLNCLGGSGGPHWCFQRQVVDQQGSPLSNATIEVTAKVVSNPRHYDKKTNYVLRTDISGVFAIDLHWECVDVTVTKKGFVSKKFVLDPVIVSPRGFPPDGKVVLSPVRHLGRPDSLDKIETSLLDIEEFKKGDTFGISFQPARVLQVSDPQALIRVERNNDGFKITCQPGTFGKVLIYEPGLTLESWLASNATMDEKGLEAEFVCPLPPQPSIGNATGAFVLKTRRYWVRATLSPVSSIRTNAYTLFFGFSRDRVFVNESQDTE